MATRESSSNPVTFLFGKSPRVRVGYLGGQMAGVGMTFKSCYRVVSEHPFPRSQSRMRGDFLWYEEQIEMSQDERDAKAARRCAAHSFAIQTFDTAFTELGKRSTRQSLPPSGDKIVPQKQGDSSNRPTAPSFDIYQGVASGTSLHTFPYVNPPIEASEPK